MTDLSATIAPRSDQLNSDDLIAGPRTITITAVKADPGSPEQPIAIYFEGDNGKPYKPCKSMRRVMVSLWGADGAKFPGRSMTLYRDPDVLFGGMKVGGIRISHMTNIDKPETMALTASKAKRANFTVRPLVMQAGTTTAPKMTSEQATDQIIAEIEAAQDLDAAITKRVKTIAWLKANKPDLYQRVADAITKRGAELSGPPTDDEIPDFEPAPVVPPAAQSASADGRRPPGESTSAEAPHSLEMPVATYDQQLAFLSALGARFDHAETGDEARAWFAANEKAIKVCSAVDSASKKVCADTMKRMDAVIQRLEG